MMALSPKIMRSKIHYILARLIILACILALVLTVTYPPVLAESGGRERASKVSVRKLQRLKRIKREAISDQNEFDAAHNVFQEAWDKFKGEMGSWFKSIDSLVQDEMDTLCYSHGKSEFCPPPPEPELIDNSYEPRGDDVWEISKYYTPVLRQDQYFWRFKDRRKGCSSSNLKWLGYNSSEKGEYAADACMNIQGNGFRTADGSDLRLRNPFQVGACPPEYPFGTRFITKAFGTMTCIDRGGAIKGKRLDLWAGAGNQGMENYVSSPSSGKHVVEIIYPPKK